MQYTYLVVNGHNVKVLVKEDIIHNVKHRWCEINH